MKHILLLLLVIPILSVGQTRTVTGKVIDDVDLVGVVGLRIRTMNNAELGTTDKDGEFKVTISSATDQLQFDCLGMERTMINLPLDCDRLEIVMAVRWTRDYKSYVKVERERKKQYDNLATRYTDAFNKGIFVNPSPCYQRQQFISNLPHIDSMAKEMKMKQKRMKGIFRELKIGDTIKIPYNPIQYSWRGRDATLQAWSLTTSRTKFDCVIKGIILDKDRRKGGYNLIYKVTGCELCKFDSIKYENKNVAAGQVFRHNMRYYKILME